MSGHESPLGKKTYSSTMKTFEIDEPSIEEEIAEHRRMRASVKKKWKLDLNLELKLYLE